MNEEVAAQGRGGGGPRRGPPPAPPLSRAPPSAGHPGLRPRLQELDQIGVDLPILGAVEPARRLGITHTPSFVLLHGDQAHRIAGIPDLDAFYEDHR